MDHRTYLYLESIITTAHGKTMPAVVKEKMINDLAIQLEQKLVTALLGQLSLTDQTAYNTLLLDRPTNETVMSWFAEHLPNSVEYIQQVLSNFEQEYLTYMKS